MSIVLLDTDVVSYLFKGDTRAVGLRPVLQDRRLAVSFMTVAELYEWASIRKWGHQRVAQLERTMAMYILIPVDAELCRHWGMLRAQRKAAGKTIAAQDAWIAATALRHGLPLITHNPADFNDIPGIEVLSLG